MAQLEMYRGDYALFRGLVILTDDTDVFSLVGCKVYFTAKNNADDLDASAVISLDSATGGVLVTDPASGEFFVEILPTLTSSVTLVGGSKTLVYDVQVKTNSVPPKIYTTDTGTLLIKQDVTQRTT